MTYYARTLTFPALLLAAVGCSSSWSQSVEGDDLDLDVGAEPVLLDVLGTLTSDEDEVLPCDLLEGTLEALWTHDGIEPIKVQVDDGDVEEVFSDSDQDWVGIGLPLTVEEGADGACLVAASLTVTADSEISGQLRLRLNLSDTSSLGSDEPTGATTLELVVDPAE